MKKSAPFFSVIIPAYNAEKFLKDSLPSVLSQSYKDFEIIIIDNGSTDNTNAIAKHLLSKSKEIPFNIIRKKINIGIAGARNVGIKKALGKFIAFLDADDIWHTDKLQEVKKIIDAMQSDLICHDELLVLFDEKTKEKKILGKMVYGPYDENMFNRLVLIGNCLSTSAVVVNKQKILDVGLFSEDKKLHAVEDYDLWIRLSKKIPFYFLHKTLGEYRVGKFNTSANFERHIENEKEIINRYITMIDSNNLKGLLDKRLAISYRGVGWFLHRQGNFTEAKIWYKKSLKTKFLVKTSAAYLLALFRIIP